MGVAERKDRRPWATHTGKTAQNSEPAISPEKVMQTQGKDRYGETVTVFSFGKYFLGDSAFLPLTLL